MALMIQREKSFLFPLSSTLSPRIWAVGPIRPSLVRGLRPRNAPPKTPAAASVWQYDLGDPLRPNFPPPRVVARSDASQRRQGNAQSGPTYTAMTINSPLQKSRQYNLSFPIQAVRT